MRARQFGLIIVGDEILSGKRADKHMPKYIEILAQRGLSLSWVEVVGDDRARITATLKRAFASDDIVISCGGIGATPDDHTRQCAAAALDVPLRLHPEAQRLIVSRMQDMALENDHPFDPDSPENRQRLQMGVFPEGASIVPNPYNKIPGFACTSPAGADVYFVPGFPVMAWPMMAWALDTYHADLFNVEAKQERSVIVMGAMEATLTPLMEQVEAQHPEIKVFSLPSVDHPVYGRHIELGVKGPKWAVSAAYADLQQGLHRFGVSFGPELVR